MIKVKPPRPPRKKVRETLKEALYEEDIIEGCSFVSYKTYEDLEGKHNFRWTNRQIDRKIERQRQKVRETLKEALYEEDIIEGFSFVSYKTYEDLEVIHKYIHIGI